MDGPSGFVANTDFDWYRFLLGRSGGPAPLDEVNFWQPGGGHGFHAIPPGSPFFFKLKKPHYKVAGFGFLARTSRVPLSLAWEAFEEKNGAATWEDFRSRLTRLKQAAPKPGEDPVIGCLMISDPVFFEEAHWVDLPSNWPVNTQQGKTYRIDGGEGARLWEDCLLARARSGPPATTRAGPAEGAPKFGPPTLVRPRLGQGTFRIAVRDAYGRACAVTGERSLPVLEAAHIRPYAEEGEHAVSNGLCLRVDIHRLFDKGYVTVDPDLRFRVSPRLREDFNNGRIYYDLDRRPLRPPVPGEDPPDRRLLEWHREVKFLAG